MIVERLLHWREGLRGDLAGGKKGRIFQTENRADCRLEESRAGVCLVHCCVLTPGTELGPSEYLWGGRGQKSWVFLEHRRHRKE